LFFLVKHSWVAKHVKIITEKHISKKFSFYFFYENGNITLLNRLIVCFRNKIAF